MRAKRYSASVSIAPSVQQKRRAPDAPPVSLEQIAAFRLSRHHLVERAQASALARVAGDMAGAQAQVLSAAPMSLAAKTPGNSVADVDHPPSPGRTPAQTLCLRGGLNLLPSDDIAPFAPG